MKRVSGLSLAFFAVFAAVLPGRGMVNNVPLQVGTAAGEQGVERQEDGLNRVLAAEFAGMGKFPYWEHVGMVGMGSGIYLGRGYVLTSAHVGCYPFRAQDGTVYEPEYKTWRVFKNNGESKGDIAIFRVICKEGSALSRLAPLPIGDAQAGANHPMLLIGTGFTQSKQPVVLSSQGRTLAILGFQVEPRRGVAWALNRSSQDLAAPVATGNQFSTQCFATRFDRNSFAGQAADGDSGGAGFAYNRTLQRWELVGCIIAVSQQRSMVPFGSQTFLGNLGAYGGQILGADTTRVASVTAPTLPLAAQPITARAAAISE